MSDWYDDAFRKSEEGSVIVRMDVGVLDVFVGDCVGGFGMCEVTCVFMRGLNDDEVRAEL